MIDVHPGKNLLEYWSVLIRRRWAVYLAVAAVGLAALIGSFLVTPLFRSTVTLQIERQNPDILTFRDLARVDYSWNAYNDFYQTQYRILSSAAVARRAVERLGLTHHPDFTRSKPTFLTKLKGLLPHRKSSAAADDPVERAAARVLVNLKVIPIRKSQLVQVAFSASDPELASAVANAVGDAYVQFNIESQYSTSDQAREFLVNQIGMLKREIEAIEERLQEYGESRRIVSVDESSNITLQALKDISERRTVAQTALAGAEARYRAVLASQPDALAEVLESDLIARLRQEYASYEAGYAELSRSFKRDWPGVQTLKSKLEQAKERLDLETERISEQVKAAAQGEYQRSLNEVGNLERLLQDNENAAQRLKRNAVEYVNLQSEVQKKRETLDTLLGRQNEMALSTRLKDMDSSSTNIKVMEPARPATAPYRPNIKLNLLLALVSGLGLGVALAFLLEHLDNSISSPQELEKLVALPVLAVIPRQGVAAATLGRVRRKPAIAAAQSVELIAHRDTRAPSSEAYRELRTSILLSSPGHPPRRIVVTSAFPDEGKTVTALNLAVVLAQLGQRVLIVDTDLRRPRLHKALNVENRRGVSTYLSGLENDPLGLVVPTGIDNLHLLPSGPVPPNPSELLNSAMFARMSEELLGRGYAHIVFDSPPVLSVADPVIVAHGVDLGVLVVRAGRTPRQSVRVAAERLRQTGGCPFGLVLNGHDPDSQGHGYNRPYYYGGYGEHAEPTARDGAEQASERSA